MPDIRILEERRPYRCNDALIQQGPKGKPQQGRKHDMKILETTMTTMETAATMTEKVYLK